MIDGEERVAKLRESKETVTRYREKKKQKRERRREQYRKNRVDGGAR